MVILSKTISGPSAKATGPHALHIRMYKNYMRGGGKGPIILDYEIINQNLLKYVYLNITNYKITK